MSRPTSDIARHTLAYATGSMVGGVSRVVLLFVIARTLTTSEYGVLALLLATTNLVHLVLELGFVTALIRFHHQTEDALERRRLRTTVFATMPLLDLILVAPLVLLRAPISGMLFGSPEYATLVGLAIGIAFFAAQFQLYLGHLRALDRSRQFAVLMAAKGAISLGVTLALVFGEKMGVPGFLLGNLAGPAIVAGIAIPLLLLRERGGLTGARPRLAALFGFGLPLVPSALGLWALSYLDGWLLRVLADLDAVGVYSFGSEICLPVGLVLTSIHLAWPSFAFAQAKREGGAAEIAKVFRHLFVILAAGALAIALLRREALVILSADAFDASVRVIPWLALATVVYGASLAFGTGLQVAGNTRRLPLLIGIAALVNAGLNVALIPVWREVGAASATVVTNVLLCALVLRESHRQFRIPFEIGRLIGVVAAAGLVLVAGDALPPMGFAAGLLSRLALLAVFPLLLVPLGALSPKELTSFPAAAREIFGRPA